MTDQDENSLIAQRRTKLDALRTLWVFQCEVRGAAFRDLADSRIESLLLNQLPLEDDALVHLRRLPVLSQLSLQDTPVTDDGLAHLEGLVNLSSQYASVSKTYLS